MSIKYGFVDDVSYGADDINYAFSRLTTQGVSLFKYTDGDNPLMSIEEAVASLTEPGVESFNSSACRVYSYNDATVFKIYPGTAFMPDGSFISIDALYDITQIINDARGGTTAAVTVYFFRNTAGNCIDIMATTDSSQIDSTKSVILAEISESNVVTDKRTLAKSKLDLPRPNIISIFSCSEFAIASGQTGISQLRSTHKVFDGVKYVVDSGTVFKIQRVTTTDGTNLTFESNPYGGEIYGMQCAYNYVDGVLQRWVRQVGTSSKAYATTLYVF